MDRTRRALLASVGGVTAGLAGCLGDLGGDEPGGGTTTTRSMPDHAALADITAQPRLGPSPGEAPGLIVGFEDPSCPACRKFHKQTLPDLRSHFESGRATFVYRGLSFVAPWAATANRALEATFARNPEAHWALNAHYYDQQDAFTEDNVVSRTETFLSNETDVEAATVMESVQAEEYTDALRSDFNAAEATDLRGTPTFYIFAEGSFRTDVVGPQDPAVFENLLGV